MNLSSRVQRWKLWLIYSVLILFGFGAILFQLGQSRFWGHRDGNGAGGVGTGIVTVVVVLCAKPQSPLAHLAHRRAGARENANTTIAGVSVYLRQLRVLVKSLLLEERNLWANDSKETVELILFSDNDAIWGHFEEWLNSGALHPSYRRLLRVRHARVSYPEGFEQLKHLGAVGPCTTFRLFLGHALPTHDSVVYLDTDVLFTRHVRTVASYVHGFSGSQWVGMAPDWYHHLKDTVPFYGAQGLNAGVGVYNLTRMRSSGFLAALPAIAKEHALKLRDGGDQGILNVYFHNHSNSDQVLQLPCSANFIPLHCIESPLCEREAERGEEKSGISIIHGCWKAFSKNVPESQFSILFDEYDKLKLNSIVDRNVFLHTLRKRLEANQAKELAAPAPPSAWYETGCMKNKHFLRNLFRPD